MERALYRSLLDWKNSPERKPLMLYGARQVGKTYLLKEFGQREFKNVVYVNCYKNSAAQALFGGYPDTDRLIQGLSILSGENITPGETFVFLDEAQEIPAVVSSLKYFCENSRELHVAVAGSLLGVLNIKGESFPVGKVDILKLYPLSFEEFLSAMGEGQLVTILSEGDWSMAEVFEDRLSERLRQYYFVGGMPEAVVNFVSGHHATEIRKVQTNILIAYEADISKHTGSLTQRVRMVWDSVPSQLAKENKKFIYGAIRKGARAKEYETAIQWLVDAGLLYRLERTRDAKSPLKFCADPNAFKLFLLDIGLLGALVGSSPAQALIGNNIFTEYKGAFTENYVMQQLASLPDAPAYYFSKDNSSVEVDFVVQLPDRIVPIEVKAEENVRSKSFSSFINGDFAPYHLKGLRLSMKGFKDQWWMENVPLYAARSFINRLRALPPGAVNSKNDLLGDALAK